ncbi:hypothetical protein AGMMS49546_06000 [Spirochaetia bacterium]|nr:hypothetical protein AGMMS49546_06000 [Spirochaetia bacterium]
MGFQGFINGFPVFFKDQAEFLDINLLFQIIKKREQIMGIVILFGGGNIFMDSLYLVE